MNRPIPAALVLFACVLAIGAFTWRTFFYHPTPPRIVEIWVPPLQPHQQPSTTNPTLDSSRIGSVNAGHVNSSAGAAEVATQKGGMAPAQQSPVGNSVTPAAGLKPDSAAGQSKGVADGPRHGNSVSSTLIRPDQVGGTPPPPEPPLRTGWEDCLPSNTTTTSIKTQALVGGAMQYTIGIDQEAITNYLDSKAWYAGVKLNHPEFAADYAYLPCRADLIARYRTQYWYMNPNEFLCTIAHLPAPLFQQAYRAVADRPEGKSGVTIEYNGELHTMPLKNPSPFDPACRKQCEFFAYFPCRLPRDGKTWPDGSGVATVAGWVTDAPGRIRPVTEVQP